MRNKQPRLIITFATTTMALKMETVCHAAKANGRLIPVPREITAGCGLAWQAQPEDEDSLKAVMQDGGVQAQEIHVIE